MFTQKRYYGLISLILLALVTPAAIWADDGSLESLLEDVEEIIVITASKRAQKAGDAPATLVVITEQMIRDRGYHHLEEILHDLPGFDFNKGYGVDYSTIYMRGIRSSNSDRFILLYDGILENDIWKQNVWLSRQYPVSQIKQIEVLYGPASALYGTNAFSGIINVITKESADVGPLNMTQGYGTYGSKNLELASGQAFDKWGYNFTFKFFHADQLHDWDFAKLAWPNNFSAEYRAKLDRPQLIIGNEEVVVDVDDNPAYYDWGLHGNINFGDFKLSYLDWTKHEYESYWYLPQRRRGEHTAWFERNNAVGLSHKGKLLGKYDFSTNLQYRMHRLLNSGEVSQRFLSRPNATNPDIVFNDPTTYKLTLQEVTIDGKILRGFGRVTYYELYASDLSLEEKIDIPVGDKGSVVLGSRVSYTDTQEDYESSFEEYPSRQADAQQPRHQKRNLATYGQLTYPLLADQLIFTGGLRYDMSRDENNDGYGIVVPRAALLYHATEKLDMRFQFAQAFQEPPDWNKFATTPERPEPSPNLEPEKLTALELGGAYRLSEKATLSATGYMSFIKDGIAGVEHPDNPAWTIFVNRSKATVYGYESSLQIGLRPNLKLDANLSGAFNYNDEDDPRCLAEEEVGGEDLDCKLIGDIAPLKATLSLTGRLLENKLTVHPKVNFVAKKKTVNQWRNPEELPIVPEVDGYAILGFFARYKMGRGLELTLKADNVFDTEYFNPGPRDADGTRYNAKILQPGLNILVGLNISL